MTTPRLRGTIMTLCGHDGIGRHARFRFLCFALGFESPCPHQITGIPLLGVPVIKIQRGDSNISIQPAGGRLGNSGSTELRPYDLPSANRQRVPMPAPNISKSLLGFGDIFVCAREGTRERPLRKHASGMFLGRGRVPQIPDASGTDVDGI